MNTKAPGNPGTQATSIRHQRGFVNPPTLATSKQGCSLSRRTCKPPLFVVFLALFALLIPATLHAAYSVSWLGHSNGGADNKIMKFNVQDMRVRKSDGRICAITWWDEVANEAAVFSGSDGAPVGYLADAHPKTGLSLAVSEGYLYIAWKSSNNHYIRRYNQNNYQPNSYNWPADKILVNSASQFIHGVCLANGKIYAAVPAANDVSILNSTTGVKETSFPATYPGKLINNANGDLWIVQRNSGSNFASGVKVVKYSATGTKLGPEITDVLDVTAISRDNSGRLMVADSGFGRNHIRYYHQDTGALIETWGSSMTSGPTPGLKAADKFDYITGVDMDTAGNLYVTFTGGGNAFDAWDNSQGAVYRKYDASRNLVWERNCLEFVDVAGLDPLNQNQVISRNRIYDMDWSQTIPGAEHEWTHYTVDRFTYPQDPRVVKKHKHAFAIREIAGQRFMYVTGMYNDYLIIYRFEGGIAIPAVMFHRKNDAAWPPNQPAAQDWVWRDLNGNGQFDAGEYEIGGGFWGISNSWNIDPNGDIWQSRNSSNAVRHWQNQGVDANGVPLFSYLHRTEFGAGHIGTDPFNSWKRNLYDPTSDRMTITGFDTSVSDYKSAGKMARTYANWSASPTLLSTVTLQQGTAVLGNSSPPPGAASVDVEGKYLFSVTADNKQVYVYDVTTGALVETIYPGSAIRAMGVVDIPHGINADRRPNNEYIIFVEDDGYYKVIMYRWISPEGLSNPGTMIAQDGFNDGGRTNGADPLDIPWARVATCNLSNATDSTTPMSGNVLNIAPSGTFGGSYGIFNSGSGVALGTDPGDSLRVEVNFRWTSTANANNQLRFGLYNNGGTHSTTDGSSSHNNDTGYRFSLNMAGGTGGLVMEAGTSATIGSGSDGAAVSSQTAGTSAPALGTSGHSLTYILTRLSGGGIEMSAALDGTVFRTGTDTAASINAFHGFYIGHATSTSSGTPNSFRIDDVEIYVID